jgi:drug/metabolite transporter (DMT)-like permease
MKIPFTIKHDHYIGIYLKILHSLTFTVMSFLMVKYSSGLSAVQEFFFIALFSCIFAFILSIIGGHKVSFKLSKKLWILYLLRSFLGSVALITWIETMKNLGINEAMSFSYATPIWLLLAAIITLNEKVDRKDIIIIIMNTIGMVMILRPSADKMTILGIAAALITTMLWAIHDAICKKISIEKEEGAGKLNMPRTVRALLFSTIMTFPIALYYWQPVNIEQISGFIIISVVAVLNLTVLFLAYVYAPVVVLVPFAYARLVFTAILSYFVYGIWPSYWCFAGAGLITVANLYFYISKKDIAKEVS